MRAKGTASPEHSLLALLDSTWVKPRQHTYARRVPTLLKHLTRGKRRVESLKYKTDGVAVSCTTQISISWVDIDSTDKGPVSI